MPEESLKATHYSMVLGSTCWRPILRQKLFRRAENILEDRLLRPTSGYTMLKELSSDCVVVDGQKLLGDSCCMLDEMFQAYSLEEVVMC